MIRSTWPLATYAIAMTACAALPSERLTRLEQEEQHRRVRLAEIQNEISRAEAQAKEARREAELQRCKADVAAIEGDVSIASAQCYSELANAESCRAANERRKTDRSLLGCGLGVAAAVFSGGSLAGLTLAGCAGGYVVGESESEACSPTTDCLQHAEQWSRLAARSRGFLGIPICGAGVEVDLASGEALGAGVVEVWREIPIQAGDVIVALDGKPVASSRDMSAALAGLPAGATVRVDLVRGVYAGLVHVDVVYVDEPATDRGRPLLGVKVQDKRRLRFGQIVVAAVHPGTPAARAGVSVGDVLVSIDTDGLASSPGSMVRELEQRGWHSTLTFRGPGGFKTASLED
jgi:hypothetical protein